MAVLLDGKILAYRMESKQKREVSKLKRAGIIPTLAVILVGDDSASQIYVSRKQEAGKRIGILVKVFRHTEDINTAGLISQIKKLNSDEKIHGIIVQFPLPKKISQEKIIEAISPKKDVDGVHPLNWGMLAYKKTGLMPCTPAAVMELLRYYKIPIKGKEVVIVGKGVIVGKPLSILLLNEDATLTVTHKETKNLRLHTKMADILISAVGYPGLIKADMVKKDVVVVDVGITRKRNKAVGDVEYKSVFKKASYITPVPGGVGPVTVAMLLENVIKIAKNTSVKPNI